MTTPPSLDLPDHLRQQLLTPPFAAVAWSAGADSTALLHLYIERLHQHHGPTLPCPVLAIHIDHNVRPDSHSDATWCQHTALHHARLGPQQLTLIAHRLPAGTLPKLQEGPARHARYQAIAKIMDQHGRTLLLTAHHGHDNLETLLLALLRGSGLTGVAGIRPVAPMPLPWPHNHNKTLVRPLLNTTPQALRQWLTERRLQWRQDPTNASLDHRRNALRHLVLPPLLQHTPDPHSDAPVLQTLRLLHQERSLLEEICNTQLQQMRQPPPTGLLADHGVAIDLRPLRPLTPAMITQLLRLAVRQCGAPHPPAQHTLKTVVEAIKAPRSTPSLTLPSLAGLPTALYDHHTLLLGTQLAPTPANSTLKMDGKVRWGAHKLSAQVIKTASNPSTPLEDHTHVEMFDAGTLQGPLIVRAPREGERIKKWGGGTKRLSRLLIDKKVPRLARHWTPVIEDSQGRVLWVVGICRTNAAPVTARTKDILSIKSAEVHGL